MIGHCICRSACYFRRIPHPCLNQFSKMIIVAADLWRSTCSWSRYQVSSPPAFMRIAADEYIPVVAEPELGFCFAEICLYRYRPGLCTCRHTYLDFLVFDGYDLAGCSTGKGDNKGRVEIVARNGGNISCIDI